MKLSILTENTAGGHFLAEHGLSFLIQLNEQTILFDTGHSDVFLKNAYDLEIDIHRDVNLIVLSHGHWDHGNGLKYLNDKPLITHPAVCMKRFRKKDQSYVGLSLSEKEINQKFKLTTTSKPYRISNQVFYLGEVPRLNSFESQSTSFQNADGTDDFVPDDSALAIIKNEKLILISGCAHSGICNICEHAKQTTGIQTIDAVVGGFHLKNNDGQTQQTIRYFKKEGIWKLYPSHCTELPALAEFYRHFTITQLKTGKILHF